VPALFRLLIDAGKAIALGSSAKIADLKKAAGGWRGRHDDMPHAHERTRGFRPLCR
jgi:hypothetical protein